LNKEWRQGSGGNGSFPPRNGSNGGNDPFNAKYLSGLWAVFSALLSVHWQGRCTLGSRLGLFPLWLRTPKCLGATLFSHSLPAGRELGAALVWGKEGILPPAPPPLRSFSVRMLRNKAIWSKWTLSTCSRRKERECMCSLFSMFSRVGRMHMHTRKRTRRPHCDSYRKHNVSLHSDSRRCRAITEASGHSGSPTMCSQRTDTPEFADQMTMLISNDSTVRYKKKGLMAYRGPLKT